MLAFANFGGDKENEYFSDGLTEEILNLLSKVPGLKVIGRTSSFSFKGKNEDLRDIGKKLGVSNLLEGSVRKSGDRIRVTAQLIDASDATHIWSETYDRDDRERKNDRGEAEEDVGDAHQNSIYNTTHVTGEGANREADGHNDHRHQRPPPGREGDETLGDAAYR